MKRTFWGPPTIARQAWRLSSSAGWTRMYRFTGILRYTQHGRERTKDKRPRWRRP